ncbi:hypothetical protein DPMN_066812 [Dreissena polymorpha]|uniref:Uncharacterized protein n=1 Tax=Dreissena polymorpha TaxID=45954 RepID=A0A9D3YYJ5_DREPO|nr:hypothetical protein DPMN_066812 [Dreissena polymorpha]
MFTGSDTLQTVTMGNPCECCLLGRRASNGHVTTVPMGCHPNLLHEPRVVATDRCEARGFI